MEIQNRKIGDEYSPYLIAEISCNHMGSLDKAMRLIQQAKDAGADAAKFQLYSPDSMTLNIGTGDFVIQEGPWKGRKMYELYAKAQTPKDWFPTLISYGKTIGIAVFASVFDKASVDYLESLDCPAYKIASFEITDTPLIAYAAQTKKPLIISTGMASMEEIDQAALATGDNDDFAMLHCVSGYPTPLEEANLHKFVTLSNQWGPCGISDHSEGLIIPVAATALGACIIEKHLIELPWDNTEDALFSMTPDEFQHMAASVRNVWQSLRPAEQASPSEISSTQLRRSLYVVQDVKNGEKFTEENVRSIRPGYGLAPKLLSEVLGAVATQDIKRGTPLKVGMYF